MQASALMQLFLKPDAGFLLGSSMAQHREMSRARQQDTAGGMQEGVLGPMMTTMTTMTTFLAEARMAAVSCLPPLQDSSERVAALH